MTDMHRFDLTDRAPVPRAELVLTCTTRDAAEDGARNHGPAIVREVPGTGYEVWRLVGLVRS